MKSKELQLSDYPEAIATKERESFKLFQEIRQLKESVLFVTAEVDRHIMAESAAKQLTNDQQRKTRKSELLEQNADYITFNNRLKQIEDQHTDLEIEINLLRAKFSVLKLDARREIAIMELRTATAA